MILISFNVRPNEPQRIKQISFREDWPIWARDLRFLSVRCVCKGVRKREEIPPLQFWHLRWRNITWKHYARFIIVLSLRIIITRANTRANLITPSEHAIHQCSEPVKGWIEPSILQSELLDFPPVTALPVCVEASLWLHRKKSVFHKKEPFRLSALLVLLWFWILLQLHSPVEGSDGCFWYNVNMAVTANTMDASLHISAKHNNA